MLNIHAKSRNNSEFLAELLWFPVGICCPF